MNSIFDRLGEKLRNYMDNADQDIFSNSKKPDEKSSNNTQQQATEEINSYKTWYNSSQSQKNTYNSNEKAETANKYSSKSSNFNSSYNQNKTTSTNKTNYPNKIPQELFKDFIRLGLSPSASLEACKDAHKSLLKKYHPDKHIGNEYALVRANEMSANINMSYQRILNWFKTGKIE